jgi:hypothetical protein
MSLLGNCNNSLYFIGTIRPEELFAYFEVEGTKFERGVFALFDEGNEIFQIYSSSFIVILCILDKSGKINFMEFVCTLWNLLTLPESNFGSVAYLLKDPSAESAISCMIHI